MWTKPAVLEPTQKDNLVQAGWISIVAGICSVLGALCLISQTFAAPRRSPVFAFKNFKVFNVKVPVFPVDCCSSFCIALAFYKASK
jgi:hypothetical protein